MTTIQHGRPPAPLPIWHRARSQNDLNERLSISSTRLMRHQHEVQPEDDNNARWAASSSMHRAGSQNDLLVGALPPRGRRQKSKRTSYSSLRGISIVPKSQNSSDLRVAKAEDDKTNILSHTRRPRTSHSNSSKPLGQKMRRPKSQNDMSKGITSPLGMRMKLSSMRDLLRRIKGDPKGFTSASPLVQNARYRNTFIAPELQDDYTSISSEKRQHGMTRRSTSAGQLKFAELRKDVEQQTNTKASNSSNNNARWSSACERLEPEEVLFEFDARPDPEEEKGGTTFHHQPSRSIRMSKRRASAIMKPQRQLVVLPDLNGTLDFEFHMETDEGKSGQNSTTQIPLRTARSSSINLKSVENSRAVLDPVSTDADLNTRRQAYWQQEQQSARQDPPAQEMSSKQQIPPPHSPPSTMKYLFADLEPLVNHQEDELARKPCNHQYQELSDSSNKRESPIGLESITKFSNGGGPQNKTGSPIDQQDAMSRSFVRKLREHISTVQDQLMEVERGREDDLRRMRRDFKREMEREKEKANIITTRPFLLANHQDTDRQGEELSQQQQQHHHHHQAHQQLIILDHNNQELRELNDESKQLEEEMKELNITEMVLSSLQQENESLLLTNHQFREGHQALDAFAKKATKKRENLQKARKKIMRTYRGAAFLLQSTKMKNMYRKCIYQAGKGVTGSDAYDHELYEAVMRTIQICEEEELGSKVLSLDDIERHFDAEDEEDSKRIGLLRSHMMQSVKEEEENENDNSREKQQDKVLIVVRGSVVDDEIDLDGEDDGADQISREVLNRSNSFARLSETIDDDQMSTLYENTDMLFAIFKFLNVDKSGSIDKGELKIGLDLLNRRLPMNSQFQDHDMLFEALDIDKSGSIDLEEFIQIFKMNDAQRASSSCSNMIRSRS